MLSGSDDKTLKLWDAVPGKLDAARRSRARPARAAKRKEKPEPNKSANSPPFDGRWTSVDGESSLEIQVRNAGMGLARFSLCHWQCRGLLDHPTHCCFLN